MSAISSQINLTLSAALSALCTCQVRTCVRCKVEQHLHSGCLQFCHSRGCQLAVVHQLSAVSAHLPGSRPPLLLQGGPRGDPAVVQRCHLCMSCKRLACAAVHCLHADVSASPVVRALSLSPGRMQLADSLQWSQCCMLAALRQGAPWVCCDMSASHLPLVAGLLCLGVAC